MRILTIFGFCVVSATATFAEAQTTTTGSTMAAINPNPDYGGYGNAGYHASTLAEGALRGRADMIRSKGEYNYNSAKGLLEITKAQQQAVENNLPRWWVERYFDLRKINLQRRQMERGTPGTPEDWLRYAQAGVPRRLSPSELDAFTGQVNWPILLRSEQFGQDRQRVERAFADRAALGSIGPKDLIEVTKTTTNMVAMLKRLVAEVPSGPYLDARRFLQSLAFEVTQPTGRASAISATWIAPASSLARTP